MSIGDNDLSKERSESSSISLEEDIIYLEHFHILFVLSQKEISTVALSDKIIPLFPQTFSLRVSTFHLCIHFSEVDPDLYSGKEEENYVFGLFLRDYFAYTMCSQQLPVLIGHLGYEKIS